MWVAFRVDSSSLRGGGHLFRCMSLALRLRAKGVSCLFVCIEYFGNLIPTLRAEDFVVKLIPSGDGQLQDHDMSVWCESDQIKDARQSLIALGDLPIECIVVDHYSLDISWEKCVETRCPVTMVVDDLANRQHSCKFLLDPTYGRSESYYLGLVSASCRTFCGSEYALLGERFADLRPYSLARRTQPKVRRLLVSMGASDSENLTTRVLTAMVRCGSLSGVELTLVVGANFRWINSVKKAADNLDIQHSLSIGARDMAELMAESDVAIGTGGTTALERCCLGLPSIIIVAAENQRDLTLSLVAHGAALFIADSQNISSQLPSLLDQLIKDSNSRENMSLSARQVTNGVGAALVVSEMFPAL